MQRVSGAALYDAMLRLLSDPALRSRLELAARARMESRFDRCYMWRELQCFYAGLLQ
jgi:glycosyltransferase involved in cell wall biosynthesis